jgi:3-isopropylmalate/(R)-2-methylmalate dehydratase small subunit
MDEILEGRVAWIFEDHYDIDLIVGVEHIKTSDPKELLPYCMTEYDPGFVDDVRPGDVLVGGRNFGYGHPHYPSLIAIRALGINTIVADSFSPGFRRGETYNGMVLVACPGISGAVERWDELRIAWKDGRVEVPARGLVLEAARPPARTVKVVEAGGMYNLLKQEHARRPVEAG